MNEEKQFQNKIVLVIVILSFLLFITYMYNLNKADFSKISANKSEQATVEQEKIASFNTHTTYQPISFDLENNISWLTKKQLTQHETLYKGYVQKRNEINEALQSMDLSVAKGNRTFSPYRALKIAETYAVNGSLLHELYFENIGSSSQDIGPGMNQLIIENFGSVARFKKDFFLSAGSARGWVMVAFGLDDFKLHIYVLEEHNQHVPVLAIPLLVLDVYEHAYMIDFGISRDPYVEQFWNTINWNIVENRIEKWVKKFFYI